VADHDLGLLAVGLVDELDAPAVGGERRADVAGGARAGGELGEASADARS
jgi:hypothetical protein